MAAAQQRRHQRSSPPPRLGWHPGERAMHSLLHVPTSLSPNPTSLGLPLPYAYRMAQSPLVALGTLDGEGRPWTSVWGGRKGFMGPIGKGDGGGMEEDGGANTEVALLGVAAMVDAEFDPLITALLESKSGEESSSNNTGAGEKAGMVVVRPEQLDGGKGKVMAGLSIDLATRDRVKFAGRIVAAAVEPVLDTVKTESSGAAEDESGPTKDGGRVGKVQMAVRVDETLGNCPKYLNKKDIAPHVPNPTLASDRLPLSTEAVDIVHQADLFFMSSTNGDTMDTNHRGGAPGFVRVATNDEENGTVLVYPEYSGNRFYQSLGNMQVKPYAGITLVNFETSDVLYLTGETTILVGPAAAALLPHAKLAVKLRVTRARQVRNGLAFRGSVLDYSPYNPPAWRLVSEQQDSRGCGKGDDPRQRPSLTLVRREVITPTIARFTFRLENPDGKTGPLPAWRAGQHVTLDFSAELDVGWSHMRDDDPASLNDDFVRTFTVSSPPPGTVKSPLSTVSEKPALAPDELQLTLRRHGPATSLLWRANVRGGLSIPVMGFAGAEEGGFRIPAPAVPSHPSSTDTTTVQQPHQQHKAVVFIAAGIGITPVLAQAPAVLAASAAIAKESQKNQICPRQPFTLLWSVRATDLPLVLDSLARVPGLAGASNIFVTGVVDAKEKETARLLDAVRDALGQQVDDSGKAKGGRLVLGRIGKDDVFGAGREFDGTDDTVRDKGKRRFMVCTGAAMLTTVREWLAGEDVVWENFGY